MMQRCSGSAEQPADRAERKELQCRGAHVADAGSGAESLAEHSCCSTDAGSAVQPATQEISGAAHSVTDSTERSAEQLADHDMILLAKLLWHLTLRTVVLHSPHIPKSEILNLKPDFWILESEHCNTITEIMNLRSIR